MKKKTPEAALAVECGRLLDAHARWQFINEHGCQDPFWPDGVNMNLVRNQMIIHRREMAALCEDNGLALPSVYYLPVPPEVPGNYMAKLDQQERVERLQEMGETLSTEKVVYDDRQLRLC
jgi:hypothetical protein